MTIKRTSREDKLKTSQKKYKEKNEHIYIYIHRPETGVDWEVAIELEDSNEVHTALVQQ